MSTAVHRKDKAFPWGKKEPTRCGKIGNESIFAPFEKLFVISEMVFKSSLILSFPRHGIFDNFSMRKEPFS